MAPAGVKQHEHGRWTSTTSPMTTVTLPDLWMRIFSILPDGNRWLSQVRSRRRIRRLERFLCPLCPAVNTDTVLPGLDNLELALTLVSLRLFFSYAPIGWSLWCDSYADIACCIRAAASLASAQILCFEVLRWQHYHLLLAAGMPVAHSDEAAGGSASA